MIVSADLDELVVDDNDEEIDNAGEDELKETEAIRKERKEWRT